jgi:hypothetical protein
MATSGGLLYGVGVIWPVRGLLAMTHRTWCNLCGVANVDLAPKTTQRAWYIAPRPQGRVASSNVRTNSGGWRNIRPLAQRLFSLGLPP